MGTTGRSKRKISDKRGIKVWKKHLPDDIAEIVQDAQNNQEKECKCNFSMESTVYLLLRKLKNK